MAETKGKEKNAPSGPVLKNLYYVMLSLPVHGAETNSEVYRNHTQRTAELGQSVRLEVPDLPVGTLDALMSISDELAKVDGNIEGVCKKVVQLLTEVLEQSEPSWTVNSVPPDVYLSQFQWDEKKYPWKVPLKETVARIQTQVQRLEADMRQKSTAYTTLARALAAESRKDAGSLATKSLHDIVKPEDIVETEYLTTLLVVVPRHSYKEWNTSYEKLTEFVLPRSSKLLGEDAEFGLYTVTLFKRVSEDYKNAAREKRFVVREFDRESLSTKAKEEREKRQSEKNAQEAKLVRWCKINFSEVFSAWIHIKIVRIFVESVLRYGLPPKFIVPLLRPVKKDEKKLMGGLSKIYADLNANQELTHAVKAKSGKDNNAEDGEGDFAIPGATSQEKFYPFVCSFIDIDLVKVGF